MLAVLMSSTLYSQAGIETNSAISYKKKDLKKLKWIEGKWRGMFDNKPFYEIYQLINDSTLRITHYKWDGNDSSKTTFDYVQWVKDGYYLGEQQNWKAMTISNKEIKLVPVNKVSNEIVWQRKEKKNWIAILSHKSGNRTYNMEHFDPFKTRK
jgi:hypothetical protein